MENSFIHLDWDTATFGFGVVRIVRPEINGFDLSRLLNKLRINGYRLAYLQLPIEDNFIDTAIANGGTLVDEKVTYIAELALMASVGNDLVNKPESYGNEEVNSNLIQLAMQSGKYSRFAVDPKFPRELYARLYTTWITRSVGREIASEVLVVRDGSDEVGFITLGSINNQGSIGLVAVEHAARKKGIGKSLVLEANRYFLVNGYSSCQVVTQRRNIGACKLYESCGFKVSKIENIFHFWLD
jgi:dTDP-4-amino-4,6-dideoxy-D-galactose acyltransferase